MARTKIKCLLKEQEHHNNNEPVLRGNLRIGNKTYPVAGWIYYNSDGTVSVSIADSTPVKENDSTKEGEGAKD